MSPLESQLGMLPVYALIVAAFVYVGVDLARTIQRRLVEDNPDLRFVSLSKPGHLPAGRAPRNHAPRRTRSCRRTKGSVS